MKTAWPRGVSIFFRCAVRISGETPNKEWMGERGVKDEIDGDRQRLVREGELTCEVIHRVHCEGVAIWESEGNLG